MWYVAVHQSGERQVIESQSASPVMAASAVNPSPTRRASHQAFVRLPSETPAKARIPSTVAVVYAPMVASVSGGCSGCPGNPRTRYESLMAALYPVCGKPHDG